MIVRYATTPLPEVFTPEQATENLEGMKTGDVPAFVIRNAGVTVREALDIYEGSFNEADFVFGLQPMLDHSYQRPSMLQKAIGLIAHRPPRARSGARPIDIPLHMDSYPRLTKPPVVTVRLHYAKKGTVEANFFDPKGEYRHEFLSERVHTLYLAGMVDDEILVPVNHQTRATEGDMIVFRFDGARPLMHYFRSTTRKRDSEVKNAFIPNNIEPSLLS